MHDTLRPPAAGGRSELLGELQGLRSDLERSLRIEWQRLRERTLDAGFRAVVLLLGLGFGTAASVTAAVLLANGLRGGLAAWTRSPWIGDLATGAILLGFLLGAGLVFRHLLRRDCVLRARQAAGGPP